MAHKTKIKKIEKNFRYQKAFRYIRDMCSSRGMKKKKTSVSRYIRNDLLAEVNDLLADKKALGKIQTIHRTIITLVDAGLEDTTVKLLTVSFDK